MCSADKRWLNVCEHVKICHVVSNVMTSYHFSKKLRFNRNVQGKSIIRIKCSLLFSISIPEESSATQRFSSPRDTSLVSKNTPLQKNGIPENKKVSTVVLLSLNIWQYSSTVPPLNGHLHSLKINLQRGGQAISIWWLKPECLTLPLHPPWSITRTPIL